MTTDYMAYVDKGQFKDLFQELGWDLPPRGHQNVHVDTDYWTLIATPVADQSGLKVWVCVSDRLPGASEQRAVDQAVSKLSQVRLLIFTDGIHQSWRWPRRGATAATNKKLLQHSYTVGNPDQREDLARRFAHIDLPMDGHIGIAEIQERMAKAFNEEAVKRSREASQHMVKMHEMLLEAECSTETSTSLLVRLLFLFFGDDTQMWPEDTFQKWVLNHTTAENFHDKLTELFSVLCDEELDKAQTAGGMGGATGKYAGTEYQLFRRIGGMYAERMELPPLPADFRHQVLLAGEFDWGKVNPDIFGSMFQQLVDLDELRKNGEHYTSEENIQKLIEPLFMEEYRQKYLNAYDDPKALLDLQEELSRLSFLDSAAGSGNFLIQTYKHLRGLEYDIITRAEELELAGIQEELAKREHQRMGPVKTALITRRDEIQAGNSMQWDATVLRRSRITMRQFYGIEINAWPAKVAATAMLLVDHLCNQVWGQNVVRLPIEETPEIICANALHVDWDRLVPDNGHPLFIFGNPPFIGQYTKTDEQTADMKTVWGKNYDGYLDYVTAWHAKSLRTLKSRPGRFAFVTTNSIVQGQPVPALFGPIFADGWRIRFAHRTFEWDSEATAKAAVHCVIVGFDREKTPQPRLWDYPNVKGAPVEQRVEQQINAYLIDAPNVLVAKRSKVISPQLGKVVYGSKPADGGHLIVEADEYAEVAADPAAAKYVRPFRGARELLHGVERWCLWLEDLDPSDVEKSQILKKRIQACREFRENSTKTGDAYKLKDIPHLFRPNPNRPQDKYLAIPRHVSESRRYFLAQRFDSEVICGDANFQVEDPDGIQFGLISSSMFISWQRTVGGRMKSDLRFANTLTWNTFPVPKLSTVQREAIIDAGQKVLEARSLYPDRSLVKLYDPKAMPVELLEAHDQLDIEVDRAFGAPGKVVTFQERQEILFDHYVALTSGK